MSKKNKEMKQQQASTGATGDKVRVVKSMPGLMTCVFSHITQSTTAEFEWTGQTLNGIWPQVLAFLKWTYDTYKSESQLRLFVNKDTGEWKAWAFPQKAHTGMTAKELTDTDEGYARTREQRIQFSDTDGWYYWGTVHHHCSMSAFQSGTDRENERTQDGIHITVGQMDRTHYDIDFRVYVAGYKLTSLTPLDFWDIGEELLTVPEQFRKLLPANTDQLLAKHQMGRPPVAGLEFPQEWRENIIDVTPKSIVVSHPTNISGYTGGNRVGVFGRTYVDKAKPGLAFDLNKAHRRIKEWLEMQLDDKNANIQTMDKAISAMEALASLDHDILNLLGICVECDVLPGDLVVHIDQELAVEEFKLQQMVGEGGPVGGHQPPTVHDAGKHGNSREHWYYGNGAHGGYGSGD